MTLVRRWRWAGLAPPGAYAPGEAEAQAREVLTAGEQSAAWAAGIVVARALRAQNRHDDARAFMSRHGVEEYEPDDDLDELED